MSGVVLRCANCGTVQTRTGECDACHEAQVRYFCTNHSPGLWLDGLACARCGARFGDVAPAPPPAPSAIGRPPRPRGMREIGPPLADPEPDRRDSSPGASGDFADEPAGPRSAISNPWLDLLAGAARASMARRASRDYADERPRRAPGGGCLRSLLLLALFLIGLFVMVPMLLGGAFLRLL